MLTSYNGFPALQRNLTVDGAANRQQVQLHARFREDRGCFCVINLDRRKRVVVDADHLLAFKQAGSFCSILRPHCEIVPDGQHGETQLKLFGNELHVVGQRGVARIVEGLIRALDDEPAGIAAIAAVWKLARMDGINVLYPAKIESPPSAMIQRVSVFDTLLAKPDDDFVIGDDRGVSSFGNFDRVGDMVSVTVRNQDVVRRDLVDLNVAGERIRCNEWVEKERFASDFHQKARVTVVGKLHAMGFSALNRFDRLRQGERLSGTKFSLGEL